MKNHKKPDCEPSLHIWRVPKKHDIGEREKKNSEIDVARCGHERERETKLLHKEIVKLGLYKGEIALRRSWYSVNEKAKRDLCERVEIVYCNQPACA